MFHSHNMEYNYIDVSQVWWLQSLRLKHHPRHFDLLSFFKLCHQKNPDHLAQLLLTVPEMWLMLVSQWLLSGLLRPTPHKSDECYQVLWRGHCYSVSSNLATSLRCHCMGKVLHAGKPSRDDVSPLTSSYCAQDSLPVSLRIRIISQATAPGNPALWCC